VAQVHRAGTALLMGLVNGLACVMKDLGLVTALGGAILGSTIVYILPALMAIATSRKNKADGKVADISMYRLHPARPHGHRHLNRKGHRILRHLYVSFTCCPPSWPSPPRARTRPTAR